MSANVKETWHDQLLAKWRGVWGFFCHGIESFLNPLTPMSDQGGISPYCINTISCRQVMRIKKNFNYGITY